jgi:hypothetical protein
LTTPAAIQNYDETTIGFHGTTKAAADAILSTSFIPSGKDSESLLGEGVYFFDNQVSQAKRWAKTHKAIPGEAVAVIQSRIKYGKMLNLTDKEQQSIIDWFSMEYQRKSRSVASLTTIIDIAAEKLGVEVVRAVRIPKNPSFFKQTTFSSDVEIILAVRKTTNILSKDVTYECDAENFGRLS